MDLEKIAQNGKARNIARMGNPILLKKAEDIDPYGLDVKEIMADLAATILKFSPSAGLAAPQIHISKRVLFYQIPPERGDHFCPNGQAPLFLINPTYTPIGKEKVLDWERCFSSLDLVLEIPRSQSIHLKGWQFDGNETTEIAADFHGYQARVLQHEVDHLDGLLTIHRLENPNRIGFVEEVMQFLR